MNVAGIGEASRLLHSNLRSDGRERHHQSKIQPAFAKAMAGKNLKSKILIGLRLIPNTQYQVPKITGEQADG